MVEQITGDLPETCPWRAFSDPVVVDTLAAYRSVSGAMGATTALLLPADPPHHIWEGVNHYRHVSAIVRAHEDKLREEREKAKGRRRG